MDKKIVSYFKRFPQSDCVYECNGMLFHTRGAAESYGDKISEYKREDIAKAEKGSDK